MKLIWFSCFSYPDVNSTQHCDDTRFSSKRLLRWTSASYQFPVLRQTLVTVEGVVDTAPVAFEGDLPPLLTAGGTLALTGGEDQVLFSPLLVLHHPDRHRQGGTVWQCDRWRLWTREQTGGQRLKMKSRQLDWFYCLHRLASHLKGFLISSSSLLWTWRSLLDARQNQDGQTSPAAST